MTAAPPKATSRSKKLARSKAPVPLDRLEALGLDTSGWDACPPRCVSPKPKGRDVYFDAEEVARVVRVLRQLPHNKGEWAGKPFDLDGWQLVWIVAPIFGWRYRSTGARVFRSAFVCVPRKAGKSTLAARFAFVLLVADGEPGAEVYSAAASKDQAQIVGQDVCRVAAASPIGHKLEILDRSGRVIVPGNGSVFRPLSKVAELAHGLNVSGGVIDELHVHKSRHLVDAIESGTQARRQPLVVTITTPDDGQDGTIFDERFRQAEQIAAGAISIPDHWVAQWGAEQDDDPFDEAVWFRSQPALGRSIGIDVYRGEANRAKETPSLLPRFRQLYLGVRVRELTRFLSVDEWDAGAGLGAPDMSGMSVTVGLDLSTTTDITAAVLLARDGSDWLVRPMLWVPEDSVPDLEHRCRVDMSRWIREGWVRATEGNVVDYARVRADIIAEVESAGVRVAQVAFDPWNATETSQELEREGFPLVEVRQTYANLSPALKELERALKAGEVAHDGNPVMRWMADSLEVRTDRDGNLKPAKPDRRKAAYRIDGMAALVTAMSRAMVAPAARRSVYETRGVVTARR